MKTFQRWLLDHKDERTPVGDLARYILTGKECPEEDNSPDVWTRSFRKAFELYQKECPPNRESGFANPKLQAEHPPFRDARFANARLQKERPPIRDSRFANAKLASIAESFQVKEGKGFWEAFIRQVLAISVIVIGVVVLVPVTYFVLNVLTFGLFLPSIRDGIRIPLLIVLNVCPYYLCYAIITKYYFRRQRHAKRVRVNALAALSQRRADPVLYLRSFADDETVNPISRGQKTYEEDLALTLNDFGPVIAVGIPKERDSPLGATRIYLKDKNWTENVKSLIDISQLIVIQAGSTEGVISELEALLERADPRKVIMSFLSWQHLDSETRRLKYQLFRSKVDGIMNQSPSPVTIKLPDNIGTAPFLVFSRDWIPELVEVSRSKRWLYRFSSSLFVTEALRPLLRERNFKLSWQKNVPYFIFLLWLAFGLAWAVVRSLIVRYLKVPGIILLLDGAFLPACALVLAWAPANVILALCRKLASLVPKRKGAERVNPAARR